MQDHTLHSTLRKIAEVRLDARGARISALLLLAGTLSIVPIVLLLQQEDLPSQTYLLLFQAFLLCVPFLCFLFLVLLQRYVVKHSSASPGERRSARLLFWLGGPFGVAWSIFEMTAPGRGRNRPN